MHTFRALAFSGLALIAAGCSTSSPRTGPAPTHDPAHAPTHATAATSSPDPITAPATPHTLPPRLALFERCTTGVFSSHAQAAADPAHYKSVRLVITRIWPEREDGLWLYVEQALASDLAHPYRQRICRVTEQPGGTLISRTSLLPGDPLRFSDGTGLPYNLARLSPEMLVQREGCDLALTYDGKSFIGRTETRDCPSEIRGAAYATSLMRIAPAGIVSWDRGYDARGNQVWGSTKGGYIFKRNTSAPKLAHVE